MAASAPLRRSDAAALETARVPSAVAWPLWCAVAGVTSAMVGVHWDIAWHRSIGRDTFWTPPHVAIYLCGILAGIAAGFLILTTTFGGRARDVSVRIWGLRGPLGAFIAAWGGVAMLTSAPFDDWWHNTYGLDVKILSPPHTVLALGIIAVEMGTLILLLGAMNRADPRARPRLEALFLYTGAMIVVVMFVLGTEYFLSIHMHSASFYRAAALLAPLLLVGISRASSQRFAATVVAAIYSLFLLGLLWILPLFHAEPKLGPVYQQVTHLIPGAFPLLLVAPALAVDLVRPRLAVRSSTVSALVLGLLTLAVFCAVQWPFANFLMAPASRNWIFGTNYFDYGTPSTSYSFRHLFYPSEKSAGELAAGLGVAAILAVVSARAGLSWGDWMRRIRR